MSNKESQWINIVRTIKLTPRERDSMRRSLVQFMEAHPVRDAENARLYIKPSRNIIKIKFLTYKTMIIGLIIALVMGGSVSYAAENTLPGDALYPVKVYVNENARVAVAFSDKSKAELAVELANRRIEEAGKLAVRGTLDVETETQVNANVESQVNVAKEKVALLKSHDEDVADEVEIDLDSVLNAHGIVLAKAKIEKEREHNEKSAHSIDVLGTILAKMESEDEDDDGDENRMAMTATLMGTTTMMNASSTLSVTTREAAEGKMKAAQNKLTEVARKLARGIASTTAQVKFSEAEGVFAQGEISFTAGAYADAFNAFKKTMQLAQQAKRLADLQEEFIGEFKVDLRESDDEDDGADDEDSSTTTSKRRGDKKDNERNSKENSSDSDTETKIEIETETHDDGNTETKIQMETETHDDGNIRGKIKIEGNANIGI